MKPRDPLWRRALIRLGLSLMSRADHWFPAPGSNGITWQDRARWRVESIGERIFGLGHSGSLDEHEMILNGELAFQDLTFDQQEKYRPLLSSYVLADDLRSSVVRWGNELLELDDHPGFDGLDEDLQESLRIHICNARDELMDAAFALTRELTAEEPPLLLEDRRPV